jgi:DNA-binding transcriptional MerR regulator
VNDASDPGGFADDQTLHSIGDVARLLDMPQHVLRYWEQRLPGLRPVKRAGGRRYYRARDIALIRHTRELVERQGYRLDAAARIAAERVAGGAAGSAASRVVASSTRPIGASGTDRRSIVAQLQAIRARLALALN